MKSHKLSDGYGIGKHNYSKEGIGMGKDGIGLGLTKQAGGENQTSEGWLYTPNV